MKKDNINTDRPITRWAIDLSWYTQRERAISALLQGCLCDACRKQLSKEGGQPAESELQNRIRECCKNSTEYINGQTPILESIFRLFIASGNEPATVAELGRHLCERRGGDISRTSEEMLFHLLKNDRYYGFRPVAN